MTGRDIMMFILENHLEDVDLLNAEEIPNFVTVEKAAVNFGVGTAVVQAWLDKGMLDYVLIANRVFIPENAKPRK